jgi:hypothetical protein
MFYIGLAVGAFVMMVVGTAAIGVMARGITEEPKKGWG